MRFSRLLLIHFALSGICLLVPVLSGSQTTDAYAQAQDAFRRGDFPKAAELFKRAAAESAGQSDALLYEAKCYVRLQDFAQAENALRQYLTNHKDSADALYLLGFVLHRERHPEESLSLYTKAAAIAPPAADDLKIVALNYVLLNDYQDAIRWLERAVQMDSRNKELWYYLGRAYYSESLVEKAENAFHQALLLDPRDSRSENNLGLVFESRGELDRAMDAYRKAIEWQSTDDRAGEQPYLNLGSLLLSLDRLDECTPFLEKSAEIAPANAQAHLKLGTAYLRKGRLPEAKSQLEAAVHLDSNDVAAHYQLGRYYVRVKNFDAAKKEFDRVAELQSQRSAAQSTSPSQ